MSERWYPQRIGAGTMDAGQRATKTLDFLRTVFEASPREGSYRVAELGIWKGATSIEIAEMLGSAGELHLFDFHDNVNAVLQGLSQRGITNTIGWGSSYKYLDSYNWSLLRLMKQFGSGPFFDYVFIDGAHTWAIDALAFYLCDALLKPGGHIDFDDYNWTLRGNSLDPERVPVTAEMYTDEQMETAQVKEIVQMLVRPRRDYTEVLRNRVFRKSANTGG